MNPEQKEYKREALIRIDKNDSYLVNFSESKVLEKKFGILPYLEIYLKNNIK